MNSKTSELDKALLTFAERLQSVNKRISKMENKFLPQLRSRKLLDSPMYKDTVEIWFRDLYLPKENPKLQYTTNNQYQSVCENIERLEMELNDFEESFDQDEMKATHGIQSSAVRSNRKCDSQNTACSNEPRERISEERNELIASIFKILPEIRQIRCSSAPK